MTVIRRTLTIAALLLAWGCSESERGSLVQVTDSAGIRIVTSHLDDQGPDSWLIDPEPQWSISGEAEFGGFGMISDIVLVDSLIVVSDVQAGRVLVFDRLGQLVQELGSRGEGPGEFLSPSELSLTQDGSLGIWDSRTLRFTSMSLDGEVRGESVMLPLLEQMGGIPPTEVKAFSASALIGRDANDVRPDPAQELTRDTALFYELSPELETTEMVFAMPGLETVTVRVQGQVGYRPIPFSASPAWDAADGTLAVASTDAYEVWVLNEDGSRVARVDAALPSLTEANREGFNAAVLEAVPQEQRAMVEGMMEDLPFPDELPSYTSLILGPEGTVWAELPSETGLGPGPRWHVFDSSGALSALVETPDGFQIHALGSGFVVGVWRDEFDVSHLRLYGISQGD